ncbi:S-formylglutathione hydrolase [Brachymonas denitrificans]|uniref:S-formylglutathione hydrolase n=1 Tax=Brachymonas denitrificans DSM 15123 TaxID=1121117 RepID=A0A1H8EBQ5_9BURK|nr:S-formylglutathione hydrolase [Brachymonas denitrificans]SEN16903.1 S-formylglutathione hydrolase [Brachymonas denitrificans DSM 15123]
MQRIEQHASFGGRQEVWQHASTSTGTDMKVGVFLPPRALAGQKCPVLYWLSGLTCNEQNFITKAGAQQFAAQHELILVAPDTSPRGEGVANDEAYDLGQGAGFYLNATQQPWAQHYRMEDYVVQELPALIEAHFPANELRGIFGHSMGGHGALTLALRHPGRYCSVSAFAPIVAPSQVPWGQKAFAAYLGPDEALWKQHDTVALIATAQERLTLLVDQGDADDFLAGQLKPELLWQACAATQHPLKLRMHSGYDHSYYFIASFMQEHVEHHAAALNA